MPVFFVAYDIRWAPSDPHGKVRSESSRFGWHTHMDDYRGIPRRLTNTTLQGTFIDFTAAQNAFYALITEARRLSLSGLQLEKHLIAEAGRHLFSSDEPV